MNQASGNLAREELRESSLRIESLSAQLAGLQKEVGPHLLIHSFHSSCFPSFSLRTCPRVYAEAALEDGGAGGGRQGSCSWWGQAGFLLLVGAGRVPAPLGLIQTFLGILEECFFFFVSLVKPFSEFLKKH